MLPPRFRPRDAEGTALRGPLVAAGRDKPWNAGRQVGAAAAGGAGPVLVPAGGRALAGACRWAWAGGRQQLAEAGGSSLCTAPHPSSHAPCLCRPYPHPLPPPQYFRSPNNGVRGGFIWADGTEAFSREAVQRCMDSAGPWVAAMFGGGCTCASCCGCYADAGGSGGRRDGWE